MPEDGPTRRWVRLRAGVPVVRRDDAHLQVGAHPAERVVLAATAEHTGLLGRLERGLDPTSLPAGQAALVAALTRSGLVLDPAERSRRTGRRASTVIGLPGSSPWHAELADRLAALGLAVSSGAAVGDLVVALSVGEPDRDLAERWLHDDRIVLFVAVVDGRVRVGPWVVPGGTACLQCLDAHARERDPRHPVLLEQWSRAAPISEAEPWLVSLALAWACADVARWCHAQVPSTWSATVWLAEDGAPVLEHWSRHPWCGCGWSSLDVTG